MKERCDASLDYALVRGTIIAQTQNVSESAMIVTSEGGFDYKNGRDSMFANEHVIFVAPIHTTHRGGVDY